MYRIEDVDCKYDFPSNESADAGSVMRVKSWIDDTVTLDVVVRPTKDDQAGYDYFFILKEFATGARYVQLIEAGGKHDSNELFIKRS